METVRRALGTAKRVLLLGVTPHLAVLGSNLTAVDNSPRMLEEVWPGDRDDRRAVLGDWTDLPFDSGSFDAIIGDAPLNAAPEHVHEVLAEMRRVLSPAGKAVLRLFCAPDPAETLDQIHNDVHGGWKGNLHALKWRIAMALAASKNEAILPVQEILSAFNQLFPDRDKLAMATGWPAQDIATLDAYVGADHFLGFPTLKSMLTKVKRHFSDVTVVASADYPLAERCPTIICRP